MVDTAAYDCTLAFRDFTCQILVRWAQLSVNQNISPTLELEVDAYLLVTTRSVQFNLASKVLDY